MAVSGVERYKLHEYMWQKPHKSQHCSVAACPMVSPDPQRQGPIISSQAHQDICHVGSWNPDVALRSLRMTLLPLSPTMSSFPFLVTCLTTDSARWTRHPLLRLLILVITLLNYFHNTWMHPDKHYLVLPDSSPLLKVVSGLQTWVPSQSLPLTLFLIIYEMSEALALLIAGSGKISWPIRASDKYLESIHWERNA